MYKTEVERLKQMKWDEIRSEYEAMQRMSCVPTEIHKVKVGHVFDENQSVLWNRQQVENNNRKYQEEVSRLNTERNKRRDAIHEAIYSAIQNEVGHNLPIKKAKVLWDFAYEKGHTYGIQEIMSHLYEIMELVSLMLDEA